MYQPTPKEGILLVADPSPVFRMLYATGHQGTVIEADNAEEILEKAVAFSPDTLVMDADFPLTEASELVWMLRVLRPEMRIVVCTDAPYDGLIEAGADQCIPKKHLQTLIREALFPISAKEGI